MKFYCIFGTELQRNAEGKLKSDIIALIWQVVTYVFIRNTKPKTKKEFVNSKARF